jgi:hypothetical protein
MYEMSQRHPVWVAENHVKPCNSVAGLLATAGIRVLIQTSLKKKKWATQAKKWQTHCSPQKIW